MPRSAFSVGAATASELRLRMLTIVPIVTSAMIHQRKARNRGIALLPCSGALAAPMLALTMTKASGPFQWQGAKRTGALRLGLGSRCRSANEAAIVTA